MKHVDQPVLEANRRTVDGNLISTFSHCMGWFDTEAEAYHLIQDLIKAHPPSRVGHRIGNMLVAGIWDVDKFMLSGEEAFTFVSAFSS